jgi:antirestriction protein ArdC
MRSATQPAILSASIAAQSPRVAPFGSPSYAAEELIAEMGSAYLCAEAGISPVVVENQAAYINGWLETLRKAKRLVVIAAAQAQKAANYISKELQDQLIRVSA